jgi:PAS domain S-box-containing protein
VDGGGYRGQLSRIRDKFFESMVKAPLAMARFDSKMNYLFATDRWMTDYGLSEKNILGRNHYEIFPDVPKDLKKIYRKAFRGEVQRGSEYPFIRKNGRVDHVNWIAFPWYDFNQTIKGIDILSEFVTSQIEAERELSIVKQQFDLRLKQETLQFHKLLKGEKKIGQMKTDLLSLVAHEFSTPLGIILIASQLLQLDLDQGDKAKASHHLDAITNATLAIRNTLTEFLKTRSIYSDAVPISIVKTDIVEVVKGLIHDMNFESSYVPEFKLEIKSSTYIFTDSFLVKQILRLILLNAVKFSSPASKIIIRIKQKSDILAISVQDFGLGILKKDQKKIFRAHYRGQNAASYPGSGMGLYIANRLVSFLEGELHFRSRIGHGSTFTLTLKDTVHV